MNAHEFEEPIIDGEVIKTLPSKDALSKCWWRMRDGKVILLKDMEDSHLRNTALFLMDIGYSKCVMDAPRRILYLSLLKMEWERRMLNRVNVPITFGGKPIPNDRQRTHSALKNFPSER